MKKHKLIIGDQGRGKTTVALAMAGSYQPEEVAHITHLPKNPENDPINTESPYTQGEIRTFSGLYMDVFDPKPEMICIEDIAHALANQCRFAGHTKRFYSVAQHSVRCSWLVFDPWKLQALMHDASEAYLLDIPKPIKQRLTGYKEMEDRVMQLIADKFNFNFPMDPEVKEVDEFMLGKEWRRLMIQVENGEPCWTPEVAKQEFLKLFDALTQPLH